MSETTQLTEYVLKSGNGRLWGMSNDREQPGKILALSDGDIILCHIKLDRAFPDRIEVLEDGTEVFSPGMVLDVIFVKELRVKTDGQDLKFYWY